jgi:hypothetical protein
MAAFFETLPTCSFCTKDAKVDGPTITGPWAYMCETHLQHYGRPSSSLNTALYKEGS